MQRLYGNKFYAKGQNLVLELGRKYDAALEEVDVLVMPTLTHTASKIPPADSSYTGVCVCCVCVCLSMCVHACVCVCACKGGSVCVFGVHVMCVCVCVVVVVVFLCSRICFCALVFQVTYSKV